MGNDGVGDCDHLSFVTRAVYLPIVEEKIAKADCKGPPLALSECSEDSQQRPRSSLGDPIHIGVTDELTNVTAKKKASSKSKGRNLSQMFSEFVGDCEERDQTGRNEYR
jgi:hypothetical protein